MRTFRSFSSALSIAAVVAACHGETAPPANPGVPQVAVRPSNGATPPGPAAYTPLPPRYENPGGMWMPHQMAAHEAKLKELGLGFDPKELTDPTSSVLGAVVSLGGCSASFVSPEGLVITNHHCAIAALQFNSTPSANLLKTGYLAKERGAEKSNGPTARVLVTEKVTDVTKSVWDASVPARTTDRQRFQTIEDRQKKIVAECEKGRPGIRCSVSSFYDGAAYYLIEQLEIRDVRLVYAPAEGIGNYGGEIDNWRWPRHTGDVSIFRAYVGKDGKPADFSADNVPYRPKHVLPLAKAPLKEGDLVFVAGYPGRTYSQKTSAEAAEWVSFKYPRAQKFAEDVLATLAKVEDPDAKIRANPFVRRFGNSLTNVKGQLDGLVKDGLLQQKEAREKALVAFIESDPARKAKYGTVLAEIGKAYADAKKYRESNAELRAEFLMPRIVSSAYAIVRMAEERPKADPSRDPDYQARNMLKLEQAQEALEKQYSPIVDEALLGLAMERSAKAGDVEAAKLLAAVKAVLPKGGLPELFRETALGKTENRLALLRKASSAELARSKDPAIRLAVALRKFAKEADERDKAFDGRMAVLKPAYFEALRMFEGKEIAPEANSTLRITYGTVRGYVQKEGTPPVRPFTMLSQVVAKNTGDVPFAAPKPLLDAFAAKKFGPYVDPELGEVPVDFLADLHITGGNSGSATLNAKGEITGLVFDGNYEALASDWLFKPATTRSIHVDLRYVMWLLDAVDGGDVILKEMGATPRVD